MLLFLGEEERFGLFFLGAQTNPGRRIEIQD
jgi:hypothetical protein